MRSTKDYFTYYQPSNPSQLYVVHTDYPSESKRVSTLYANRGFIRITGENLWKRIENLLEVSPEVAAKTYTEKISENDWKSPITGHFFRRYRGRTNSKHITAATLDILAEACGVTRTELYTDQNTCDEARQSLYHAVYDEEQSPGSDKRITFDRYFVSDRSSHVRHAILNKEIYHVSPRRKIVVRHVRDLDDVIRVESLQWIVRSDHREHGKNNLAMGAMTNPRVALFSQNRAHRFVYCVQHRHTNIRSRVVQSEVDYYLSTTRKIMRAEIELVMDNPEFVRVHKPELTKTRITCVEKLPVTADIEHIVVAVENHRKNLV